MIVRFATGICVVHRLASRCCTEMGEEAACGQGLCMSRYRTAPVHLQVRLHYLAMCMFALSSCVLNGALSSNALVLVRCLLFDIYVIFILLLMRCLHWLFDPTCCYFRFFPLFWTFIDPFIVFLAFSLSLYLY